MHVCALTILLAFPAIAGPDTCGDDAENCFVVHATPGCDDVACCELVCADDPFCCDVEWDDACVQFAQLTCPPGPCIAEGDCFTAHPTPGCNVSACCTIVCFLEPFCCTVEWDEMCVDLAVTLCDQLLCPGDGDCFEPHAGGGCDEPGCCALVCTADSFCCDVEWDASCVGLAEAVCLFPACALEPDPDADPEPEACGEAINDGCFLPRPAFTPVADGQTYAGEIYAADNLRDIDWYTFTLDDQQQIHWQVTSEFPSQVVIARGDCASGIETLAFVVGGGCDPVVAAWCADPGTYYLIVGPGTAFGPIGAGAPCPDSPAPQFFGRAYHATLTVGPCAPPCLGELTGDLDVGPADLAALLAAWGPAPAGEPADFNDDGAVDAADLAVLLAQWGDCPPA